MQKRILLLVLFFLISAFSVNAFVFQGYVNNATESFVSNVNVSMVDEFGNSKTSWTTQTDANGFFKINTKGDEEGDNFLITVYKYKDNENVSFLAPSFIYPIPKYILNEELKDKNITMADAFNLKITAYNSTDNVKFRGEIRDAENGLNIENFFNKGESEFKVVIPKQNNVTIVLYEEDNYLQKAITLNNLTKYFGDYLAINVSFSPNNYRLTGYANVIGNTSPVTFTDIVKLNADTNYKLAKNSIYVPLGYKIPKKDDFFNSDGFFNTTLADNQEYVIMILANNSNEYFGGFINLSKFTENQNINVTLRPLTGSFMSNALANTKYVLVNVTDGFAKKNSKDKNDLEDVFVTAEFEYGNVKYSFSDKTDNNGAARFIIPKANADINVFSRSHAPKSKQLSTDELNVNSSINIEMERFDNVNFEKQSYTHNVGLNFYKSSSLCDVPNPPNTCLLNSFENSSTYSPMQNMFTEKISARVVQPSTGIVVHYINLDTKLAGTPSASFDENSGKIKSGKASEELWRFGSTGTSLYESILLGMPYTESNMNESAKINVTINNLYDNNFNTIWDTSINGSDPRTSLKEYADYDPAWFTGVICDDSDVTKSCYVNKSSNTVWIRIPHFSGVGPTIGGETPAPSTTQTSQPTSDSASISSNGEHNNNGGSIGSKNSFDAKRIRSGEVGSLGTLTNKEEERLVEISGAVSFRLGNKKYTVTLKGIGDNKAVLGITFLPEEKNKVIEDVSLDIGETKEISLDDNKYPDLKISFKEIENSMAKLGFTKIGTIRFTKDELKALNEKKGLLFTGDGLLGSEATSLTEAGKEIGKLLYQGKIMEVIERTQWWMWLLIFTLPASAFFSYEYFRGRLRV